MSLEYIADTYKVPAEVGQRVVYSGEKVPRHGTITGSRDAHILVRLDDETEAKPYHPTWEMAYGEPSQ